jgi:DNA-binding NtrC family response regulator
LNHVTGSLDSTVKAFTNGQHATVRIFVTSNLKRVFQSFALCIELARNFRALMTTILLVDDDPLRAQLRKSILQRRFHDVERVADAAEALCLVEQSHFANHLGLVISGLNMPGIGGPAFVAELHERLPRLPVLVLGSAIEAESDYKGGWIKFLPRPWANDQILAAADKLLAPIA